MPDHPRTRGVYPDAVAVGYADEGSSPHTRGLPRPALAAAEPIASPTPEQCRTVLSEFAMFEAFIAACPRIARAEIDTRTRLNNVYEGFARYGECGKQIESEPIASMLREHPAIRLLGQDGKRRPSRAEADAFCRRHRGDLTRIVLKYNPGRNR